MESKEAVRIYLTVVPSSHEKNLVRLMVFFKGSMQIEKNLVGFLKNQNIICSDVPQKARKEIQEFAYFDDGFIIEIDPRRWSFYDLRSFIQSYADMCEDDFIIKDNISSQNSGVPYKKEKDMDAPFFLGVTKELERCLDRYYQQNMSISLFLSGILKMMRQHLQLYWAAAKIVDNQRRQTGYLNYEPTTFSHIEIAKSCNSKKEGVLCKNVTFWGDLVASFYLMTGPFSPPEEELNCFFEHMMSHTAGFLYGHLMYKRETNRLRSEIAELKRISAEETRTELRNGEKTLKTVRIVILGDALLSNSQINSEITRAGIDIRNVEIHTDHNKYHSFDTNNLLSIRSRFDGILLGPMPHRMKGDFERADNLMAQMERNRGQYPPFVVIRDKRGDVKITKGSLRRAIEELLDKINRIGNYEKT